MWSAKQGYHLYNVFGMTRDWGLNPGPTALDASTLPLGYGGGGNLKYVEMVVNLFSEFGLPTMNYR